MTIVASPFWGKCNDANLGSKKVYSFAGFEPHNLEVVLSGRYSFNANDS